MQTTAQILAIEMPQNNYSKSMVTMELECRQPCPDEEALIKHMELTRPTRARELHDTESLVEDLLKWPALHLKSVVSIRVATYMYIEVFNRDHEVLKIEVASRLYLSILFE